MPLPLGTRLGPYEVVELLGSGAMGEVYRARDSRLERDVAIKVLPAAFSADLDRLRRFEQEARAAAALNHPNILAVYDVGTYNGAPYIVSELLEGETLRSRLSGSHARELAGAEREGAGAVPSHEQREGGLAPATGDSSPQAVKKKSDEALPVRRALDYAVQITHGLAAAHDKRMVHRDLKPENIFITRDDRVKILDFGLAKLTEAPPVRTDLSQVPTSGGTQPGMVLGTMGYLAPEQLRGQTADHRSDIFAFGAILYELLSGHRAFWGDTPADTISAILDKDPPPLPLTERNIPISIARVAARCLEKNPAARFQSVRDLGFALEALDTESGARALPSGVSTRGNRERVAWTLLAVAIGGLAALTVPAILYFRRPAAEPILARLDVVTPPTTDPLSFALSPNGRQLALVATADGKPGLWVRPLDQTTARPLAGTEGASYPFWAPAGSAIGFFADAKLKRVDLAGGATEVLADAPFGRGGTWNRDGVIVFAPTSTTGLMRIAAAGGTPVALTRPASGQGSHRWPRFLPDGRRFLFFVTLGQPEARGVYIGSLDGGEPTRVLVADSAAEYAPPGYLLLASRGVLVARRFDVARGSVSEESVPVAQAVGVDSGASRSAVAASETGVLAYRIETGVQRQLIWVDRAGKTLGVSGPPDDTALANPELAPDGRRVAVVRAVQGNADVWLIEADRGSASRITFDSAVDSSPIWSPDGRRIIFRSSRNGQYDLFEKPASGAADEQPLLVTGQDKSPQDWSPDGKVLLYTAQDPKTGSDLWALPLVGERKPYAVVQTTFDEIQGQFSPNGRWIAYASNETGRSEIYVRSFPSPGGKWQVSTEGGIYPRWRRDGKELFYLALDNRLMAVPIQVALDSQTLNPGAAVALFLTRLAAGVNVFAGGVLSRAQYAVASDGRILMNVDTPNPAASPITVVLNWTAALPR